MSTHDEQCTRTEERVLNEKTFTHEPPETSEDALRALAASGAMASTLYTRKHGGIHKFNPSTGLRKVLMCNALRSRSPRRRTGHSGSNELYCKQKSTTSTR